jgi:hypothetical protein
MDWSAERCAPRFLGGKNMATRQPRYSKEEFARRGDEIHDREIRPQGENEQNNGKFVLIDIQTASWETDADEMAASRRMDARLPDPQARMVRVGFPYVNRFGAERNTSQP